MSVLPQRLAPLIVHTTERASTPGGLSYAHGEHPFVAFVHLLKSADQGNGVNSWMHGGFLQFYSGGT